MLISKISSVIKEYIPDKKKKKRNSTIFLKFSIYCANTNCNKIIIFDQILLKLECGVDKYMFLPYTGT